MHFFCVQLAVGILICNVFDDVFAVEIAPKAFKFQWSRRETRVEMLWKENADDTDRWLGATSKPETPGFFMLKTIPVGRPRVAPKVH